MDPDSLAMSSYQFVNSLASCYPQTQLNPQHQQNHQPNSTNNNSGGATGGPQMSGNDYFPASAYTPNLYPGTPQAHYASSAYNLGVGGGGGGGGVGGQQNPADMVDYTQLQPQRLLLNQQQQQQTAALTAQSCKYAAEVTATATNNNTSISSPQDLSTARDISPKLSPNTVAETVARQINKTSSSTVSSTNSTGPHPVSGLNAANNHTTQLPMHSPGGDSETSSESGGEEGDTPTRGSGKKGVPPQIYPWMKRVHLGQSEYSFSNCYYFFTVYARIEF